MSFQSNNSPEEQTTPLSQRGNGEPSPLTAFNADWFIKRGEHHQVHTLALETAVSR